MSTSVMAVVPTAATLVLPLSPPLAWPSPAYECALASSDIDLSLRDDLSASVQDYLMRIVDELQQLSKWAGACQSRVVHCEIQQQQLQRRLGDETRAAAQQEQLQQQASAALLLAQTETQLLRGETQRLGHELVQRTAAQLAYVQNSIRFESSEQVADVERRVDDKLRALSLQLSSSVDSARTDADERFKATDATLRQATHQLHTHAARLTALEGQLAESLPAVASTLNRQQLELAAQQRRLDQLEAATAQQLSELNGTTREALAGLRDAQAQLATKLKVVRVEMREQQRESDDHHQQRALTRSLHGGPHQRVAPGDVVVAVGAAALLPSSGDGSDCFLHAKAALAPRSSDGLGPRDATPRRQTAQSFSTLFSNMTTATTGPQPLRGSLSTSGARATPPPAKPGSVEAALRIHSSTLSQPVGREEDEGLSQPMLSSTTSGLSPRKTSLRVQASTSAPGVATAKAVTLRPQAPRRETAQR